MSGKAWVDWELAYLRKNWPKMGDAEIGAVLSRSASAVRTMRYKLGVKIDPADWSADEDAYIQEHWVDQTDEEIGTALGKPAHACYERGVSLGLYRRQAAQTKWKAWTKEDDEYLSEKWGTVSVKALAKTLGRTEGSIINRKARLGLGGWTDSGDYITFNQFMIAFYGSNSGDSYKLKSWVKNRGFPMRTKVISSKRVRVIYLDEF